MPKSRKGHDYLYVIMDRFSKMCIFRHYNKQITDEQTTKLFLQHVWVHFGLPTSIVSDRDSQFAGKFWSSLWELMDTRMKKSTTFDPQIDGQIEISPFETCFGFISRSPLDFVFEKDIGVVGHSDVDKATKFIEQIQEIHQEVQEQLEKSQTKYKARHDKHIVEHNFQVGNQVWLYISKDRMQGDRKKLKTIRFFEPSLIEDPEEKIQLPSIDDLFPGYLSELQEDTVLDRKVRTTRKGDAEYLRIGLKCSKPSSAKWIEIGQVRQLYPHLVDA
eukprot:PITA_22872